MPATSLYFLGDIAVFVGAEENAAIVNEAGEVSTVAIHGGAILCAASDGKRIVTGGDDGKLTALDAKGVVTDLATDPKRRWIDNVALHPDGAVAWSAGKTAFVRSGKARGQNLRYAVDRRRSGVCAKGPAPGGCPLQWRDAVVSQHGREPGISGMGRLASRRHLQPGQQIPGHRDARAGDARLAARRQPPHADERLSRPRPFDVVERRRQGPRHIGRGYRDHLAVRQQGRSDGQGACDAGAAAGPRLRWSPVIRSRTSWPPATATAPC